MPKDDEYYFLDASHVDPKRMKRERDRAQALRQTPWWKEKIAKGICEHCGRKFQPKALTMDHLVPLARGGESTKNNVVPSCKECNAKKKLDTPVDALFRLLEEEKKSKE